MRVIDMVALISCWALQFAAVLLFGWLGLWVERYFKR